MGLSNHWKSDKGVKFDHELRLINNGIGEGEMVFFGGKCYHDMVFGITNISLGRDEISNEAIIRISEVLDETSYKAAKEHADPQWEMQDFEYDDFRLMFRKYAEAGATLTGSW
jgi:hypothetical protein